MMKKQFTEEQVMQDFAGSGSGVADHRRDSPGAWVSEQSFYRWRQKFGGRRMGRAKLDHCPIYAPSEKEIRS